MLAKGLVNQEKESMRTWIKLWIGYERMGLISMMKNLCLYHWINLEGLGVLNPLLEMERRCPKLANLDLTGLEINLVRTP